MMKLISKGLLEKIVETDFSNVPSDELDHPFNEAALSRYKGVTTKNSLDNPFVALISFHRANLYNR